MATVEIKSRRSTIYELKVKMLVQHEFNDKIKKLPRMSTARPSYRDRDRVEKKSSVNVEVWHYNLKSDPDRLITTIKFTE